MKILLRIVKWFLGILLFLILAFVAYFAFWNYQQNTAKVAAEKFCASIGIGADLSAAIARAEAEDIVHSGNETRHLFNFRGAIFNAFHCWVTHANGKVTGKELKTMED